MYLRIKSNNFLINTLSIFGLLALAMRHNFIYVVILSVMLIGLHLIFHYLKNLNLSYVSKENKFLITPSNKKEKLLKTLVFFELLLFSFGLYLPLTEVTQFWFFSENTQIIFILEYLFNNGEVFLAYLILLFGVFGTYLKILLKYINVDDFNDVLQKFSFFDIFVVSLLIFSSKLSVFLDVEAKIGTYLLVSALMISFIQIAVKKYYILEED